MEQTPLNFNSQNEDKSAINIPPVSPDSPIPPNVYPAEPVSPVMDDNPLRSSIDMNAKQTGQQFKLASTEVQGPKPPLVSGDNSKLALIAIALVLITIVGIGGYYFYMKNNNSGIINVSDVVLSPTPTEAPIVDKNLDTDSDGLPDEIEKIFGTGINNSDSDNDTFSDLNEIKNGYSPLVAGGAGKYTPEEWANVKGKIKIEDSEFYNREFGTPVVDKNLDTDKDGLPDEIEKKFSTDISKADTDGDGVNDLQEIKNGYNPTIAGEAGKYTSEDAASIFAKMSAENNEFIMREIIQPALSKARDKARVASYRATVSSLQIGVLLCCDDNSENILQSKEGAVLCSLASVSNIKLPVAADIYASSIIYSVLGQCNMDNPGISIVPVGFSVSACNAAAKVRADGVVFPEGC